jgi:uncharacterized coiled-coil protein SlyX
MDERIELETKFTFLEKSVAELNEVVYAQQKQIDLLELALKRLRSRLEETTGDTAPADPDQPPPHY